MRRRRIGPDYQRKVRQREISIRVPDSAIERVTESVLEGVDDEELDRSEPLPRSTDLGSDAGSRSAELVDGVHEALGGLQIDDPTDEILDSLLPDDDETEAHRALDDILP